MSPRFIYSLLNLMAVCMVASPLLLPAQVLPFFLAALALAGERLRRQLCISIIQRTRATS
jgi:hypothetical protein